MVVMASTLVMGQVYKGVEMGTLDTDTSAIKEVLTTSKKECVLKAITGCRIGPAICGVRFDYYDCDFVRARTAACKDKE